MHKRRAYKPHYGVGGGEGHFFAWWLGRSFEIVEEIGGCLLHRIDAKHMHANPPAYTLSSEESQ